jgi:serine/threonine protein kinase
LLWCGALVSEVNNSQRKTHLRALSQCYQPSCLIGGCIPSYVELVHEPATSSIFAMKRMACTDDDELESAKREISMYQEFNHPNLIVRLV